MDRVLVVKKPEGFTSRDVVNILTKTFKTKKVGHTGTLDPIATGVLVCVIGKYTKLVNLLTAEDKEYVAEIKLGIKTDTGDITGSILDTSKNNVDIKKIEDVFNNFPKFYEQMVPKYSAVKINGKKLYEYARNNEEVNLPKREVKIYSLELVSYHDDLITFKTKVSKGTYIRSLIEDICDKLGVVGTMNSLIRTRQGEFKLEDAYSLDDIKNNNYQCLTIHDFLNYPSFEVPDKYLKTVLNGGVIPNNIGIKDKVILTHLNKDIAIYEKFEENLKPYVMF